jgi:hypothetical protein
VRQAMRKEGRCGPRDAQVGDTNHYCSTPTAAGREIRRRWWSKYDNTVAH